MTYIKVRMSAKIESFFLLPCSLLKTCALYLREYDHWYFLALDASNSYSMDFIYIRESHSYRFLVVPAVEQTG